MTFQP
ncbi:hypothetical protein ECEC1865_6058, partial [Escherichia coli EC1865]